MQTMNVNQKVILTGGHAATTAMAVIQEINRTHPSWEVHWIGATKPIEGTNVDPIEKIFFSKMGVRDHYIVAAKLQRKFTKHTLLALARLPVNFVQSVVLIGRIKPCAVLSFGGSTSVTVAAVARLLRIPIVVHEQTAVAGLGNEIVARFADKVAISRESSKAFFPSEKVVLTGNPVGQLYANYVDQHRSRSKHLLVIGGSRGSGIINEYVSQLLPKLLKTHSVTHVCGAVDFDRFNDIKNLLPLQRKRKYSVFAVVEPHRVFELLTGSCVVLSRAGANLVAEIALTHTPAVFIPIPWSYRNEQYANASLLAKNNRAIIVDQKTATSLDVYKAILKAQQLVPISYEDDFILDKSASHRLVELLEGYC